MVFASHLTATKLHHIRYACFFFVGACNTRFFIVHFAWIECSFSDGLCVCVSCGIRQLDITFLLSSKPNPIYPACSLFHQSMRCLYNSGNVHMEWYVEHGHHVAYANGINSASSEIHHHVDSFVVCTYVRMYLSHNTESQYFHNKSKRMRFTLLDSQTSLAHLSIKNRLHLNLLQFPVEIYALVCISSGWNVVIRRWRREKASNMGAEQLASTFIDNNELRYIGM